MRAPTDRHSRSEGGFALMAVLGVIALTAITVGALFGLMLTTISVTEAQQRSSRESRAYDGAVVAAINNLRLRQSGQLDVCASGVPAAGGLVVPFVGVGDVTVTCDPGGDALGPSAGDVELVGDRYAGALTNWESLWAATPWGVDAPATEPSLVHTGEDPLVFNGSVMAVHGIAGLLTDGSTAPGAVSVRGAASQSVPGPGGTGTSCGLLDGPGEQRRTKIGASAGITCGDTSLTPVVLDESPDIDTTPRSPAATCPAVGNVVTLEPGSYNSAAVRTLNTWFGGSLPSCVGKTFLFTPGKYWFDANSGSALDPEPNAVVFDDPTASFVFGTPNGWSNGATAANFPRACDPNAAGASIILSARTELRHLGGRLAVCPFSAGVGAALPALSQQNAAPGDVVVTAGAQLDFSPAANLVSDSPATYSSATFGCLPANVVGNRCNAPVKRFALQLASDSTGPIGSARLLLGAQEPGPPLNGVMERTIGFVVTPAGSATGCTVDPVPFAVSGQSVAEFDLLRGNACGALINNGRDLDGATVVATVRYEYRVVPPNGIVESSTLRIWSADVELGGSAPGASLLGSSTGWANPGGAVDGSGGGATILLPCGARRCGDRAGQAPVNASITVGAASLHTGSSVIEAADPLRTLGILVSQDGTEVDLPALHRPTLLKGQVVVSVTNSTGVTCQLPPFSRVPNTDGATYYPLFDELNTSCSAQGWDSGSLTASALDGSTVTYTVRLDCEHPYSFFGLPRCGNFFFPSSDGFPSYVQPPAVRSIGLVATTDAYNDAPTVSSLTIDSAAGSSANFFGSALLPNTALDLTWTSASGASVFGGDLRLFSLGSQMVDSAAGDPATADAVCCTLASGGAARVVVTASTPGDANDDGVVAPGELVPRRRATVSINRVSGTVEVLDWIQCGRNGACAPLGP